MALQFGKCEHFIHAGLVRRDFRGRPELHLVARQKLESAGFFLQIGAVKKQQILSGADEFEKIHTERAAVGHLRPFGKLVAGVECFNGANAEAFVGPEDVSDAQNEHVGRFKKIESGNGLHAKTLTNRTGRTVASGQTTPYQLCAKAPLYSSVVSRKRHTSADLHRA